MQDEMYKIYTHTPYQAEHMKEIKSSFNAEVSPPLL